MARRDLGRRFARAHLPERDEPSRPGRAQGRDGDASSAARDGASPPPLRGGRRGGQRRDDRHRGHRGRLDPQVAGARPGSSGRAPRRGAGSLADPAGRQRDRRRRRRPGVGVPRPRRGRRSDGAAGRADAGPPAAAPDGVPAGHARRRQTGDAAPGGGRDPRPRRRVGRPVHGRLGDGRPESGREPRLTHRR